jgi:Ca2+-binding RTX toxin-like protein
MSKRRQVIAASGVAAIALVAVSSVAAARPGPLVWIRDFDNVWIDRAGVDAFTATPGDRDLLIALDGDDVLDAGDRADLVYGDGDDDTIVAGPGHDRVRGGAGADDIDAGRGWDRVAGGRGADTIDGGPGLDRLFGEAGHDTITGGPGPDLIEAGYGDDVVQVVDGRRDLVRCGPGIDTVTADPQDRVGPSCEHVIRVAP